MLKEIIYLIEKEITLEWKQKSALSGIFLYVVSTIFVCYLSFKNVIDIPTWNALFWIIMLFASLNAVSKSFMGKSEGKLLYLYSLAKPQSVILAKIIYNSLLLLIVSLVSLLFYSTLIGSEVYENSNKAIFITALVLGTLGFSSLFTMVSAISSKTESNFGIMGILGFPLIIPLLLSAIRMSKIGLDGFDWDVAYQDVLVLTGINLIIVILSYILFPYLWRD